MVITANIATQPSRAKQLVKAVESLQPQVDKVRVFANQFKPFSSYDNVEVVELEQNLADNAKFQGVDNPDEYYFSCDDDIIYPPDYVEYTLDRLRSYPHCIVTHHGRKLQGSGRNYYYGHQTYHCLREVAEDQFIDVAGTGVSAFNTNMFRPYIPEEPTMMSDLLFSLDASVKEVEIIILKHSMGWIRSQRVEGSIYLEQNSDCQIQSRYADKIFKNKTLI